jgi:hypothetical protein
MLCRLHMRSPSVCPVWLAAYYHIGQGRRPRPRRLAEDPMSKLLTIKMEKQPQNRVSSSFARSHSAAVGPDHHEHPILHLQRTIGNQAVQPMLQAHAQELEAGFAGMATPRFGLDFSRIPIHPPAVGAIQTKLAINKPRDRYEQEADRISEQVMQMPELPLQWACAHGETCPKFQTELPTVHERLQNGASPSDAVRISGSPIVHDILRSPGQPLDAKTRAFFEPRFGHDFGQIRVHTSGRAAQSARAIDAMAYTAGREIVFGTGTYAPETTEGRRLLAHELTHTIQQGAQTRAPALVQRWFGELRLWGFNRLRDELEALVKKNVSDYATYRDSISKSISEEKEFALLDQELLSSLQNTLALTSFERCVELLGRKPPTFKDLITYSSVVREAIADAWQASNPGIPDPVLSRFTHEEGGWVFMNLIDGNLSTERATPDPAKSNAIDLSDPPNVASSVIVATFHTHPNMGPKFQAEPDSGDIKNANKRGVPNLIAANPGTKPDVYRFYLAGPAVRKHLASETKFPGSSGGIAP